jgi:hypothetical protein
MRFRIMKYAYRHAMPAFGFTPQITASIIGAIIMMETGTTNKKELYVNWPLSRAFNQLGDDRSLGIGNIRPSVAIEILCGIIPLGETWPDGIEKTMQVDLGLTYITKRSFLSDTARLQRAAMRGYNISNRFVRGDNIRLSQLLDDMEFAIDLIGANLKRGILRANRRGIKPSIFNLAGWHNCGVQDVQGFKSCTTPQKDTIGYAWGIALDLVDQAARLLLLPRIPDDLRYNDLGDNSNYDEAQLRR